MRAILPAACFLAVLPASVFASSTTTTTTTTSTTLLEGESKHFLMLELTAASGAPQGLEISIDYSGSSAAPFGANYDVRCDNVSEAPAFAAHDDEEDRRLDAGWLTFTPIARPMPLMVCEFRGELTNPPSVEDFAVSITFAGSVDDQQSVVDIAVRATLDDAEPRTCTVGCAAAEDSVECDEQSSLSECTCLCRLPACGDGFVRASEACDDGNTIDTDACSNACVAASCGDGLLSDGAGETCDDGNTADRDGCRHDCRREQQCGDVDGNDTVNTTDALAALARAVRLNVVCPDWTCDTDDNGTVTTSDAARILRAAVGSATSLQCSEPDSLVIRVEPGTAVQDFDLRVRYSEFLPLGSVLGCQPLVANFLLTDAPSKLMIYGGTLVGFDAIAVPTIVGRCQVDFPMPVREGDFQVTGSGPVSGLVRAIPY